MPPHPTGILFVCLGNICRSPLAEAVFRHQAAERGVADRFHVDSAGTSAYHEGEPPDRRSAATARGHGVSVTGSSRRVTAEELGGWDWVIAMDAENLAELEALATRRNVRPRLHRLREWDPQPDDLDVPDPYFGAAGFVRVHEIVSRSVGSLLDALLENGGDARSA